MFPASCHFNVVVLEAVTNNINIFFPGDYPLHGTSGGVRSALVPVHDSAGRGPGADEAVLFEAASS